jgi:hypothetical protein
MKTHALAGSDDGGEVAFPFSLPFVRRISFSFCATALLTLAFPASIAAQTVINSLDPGQLNTALQGGGSVTFSVSGTIVLTNTITLSNTVILDGTNQSITISGGGSVQLFNITSAGQVIFRNLTMANGVDNNGFIDNLCGCEQFGPSSGGAIYTQGSLEVYNSTFTNNHAPGGAELDVAGHPGSGGAIFNTGWLTVTNTVFANNSASGANVDGADAFPDYDSGGNGSGGAIYNGGGSIGLGNVTFSNNSADGGYCFGAIGGNACGSAYGGALYSSGGVITANNLLVVNNSASGGQYNVPSGGSISGGAALGGGFYSAGSMMTISNSIISNNTASGGSGNGIDDTTAGISQGGGIYNSGLAIFWQCNLVGNQANGALGDLYGDSSPSAGMGGAIYNAGTMQFAGSTISNSSANGGVTYYGDPYEVPSADGLGGAIYNAGVLEIQDASMSANDAAGGSAGYGFDAMPGNGWGGAIYNTGGLQIQGATLSANDAAGGAALTGEEPPGNGAGGAIFNAGFAQFSSTVLSSNLTSGTTNIGEAIDNAGVMESDANSMLVPYLTGAAPLAFQWQTNGINLAGSTNSTFNLGSVQFATAETYDLVISDGSGLVTNFEEIVNQPLAPLTISSLTPDTGLINTYNSLTVVGTGFTSGATVYFGNSAGYIRSVNSTNIVVLTPSQPSTGLVNVIVTNGDFQTVVLTNGFAYGEPPQNLSASLSPGQGMHIQFAGTPTYAYVLVATTNLVPPIVWRPIVTNPVGANGIWTFTDTNASSLPARFYRAELP